MASPKPEPLVLSDDERQVLEGWARRRKTAQALALFDGLDFVTPEHIREVATPVIAHRLVLEPQAKFSGITAQQVVEEVLKGVPVPV